MSALLALVGFAAQLLIFREADAHLVTPAEITRAIPESCASLIGGNVSSVRGTCVGYFGVCSPIVGNRVWVGENDSMVVLEEWLQSDLESTRANAGILSQACLSALDAWICARSFFPCRDLDDGEGVPRLPCASMCQRHWIDCVNSYKLLFLYNGFNADNVNQSSIVNCQTEPGGPGTFPELPQPADRFGERPFAGAHDNFPEGYRHQLRAPLSSATYTTSKGQAIQVECMHHDPLPALLDLDASYSSCADPFESQNGSCVIPCPYPILPRATLDALTWAYVVPALAGLVLCSVTLADVTSYLLPRIAARFMFSLKFASASSSSDPTTSPPRVSINTHQALAAGGSVLGIMYFGLGPGITLTYGADVSCADGGHGVTIADVAAGRADQSTTACRAQRVAPFVLQWLQALVLLALVKLYLQSSYVLRHGALEARIVLWSVALYAICVPLVCLAVTMSIEGLSNDIFLGQVHLSRQSVVCVPRFNSVALEMVLVHLPFFVTGAATVMLTVVVHRKLAVFRGAVAKNQQRSHLDDLLARLSLLGSASFAVLVVMAVCTSVLQTQLQNFGEPFANSFVCQTVSHSPCVDCDPYTRAMQNAVPSPIAYGFFLASQSTVVALFGLFFGAHTLRRLRRALLGNDTGSSSSPGSSGRKGRDPSAPRGGGGARVATTIVATSTEPNGT